MRKTKTKKRKEMPKTKVPMGIRATKKSPSKKKAAPRSKPMLGFGMEMDDYGLPELPPAKRKKKQVKY